MCYHGLYAQVSIIMRYVKNNIFKFQFLWMHDDKDEDEDDNKF